MDAGNVQPDKQREGFSLELLHVIETKSKILSIFYDALGGRAMWQVSEENTIPRRTKGIVLLWTSVFLRDIVLSTTLGSFV